MKRSITKTVCLALFLSSQVLSSIGARRVDNGGIYQLISTVVDIRTGEDGDDNSGKDDDFTKGADGSGFIVGDDGYIVTNYHVIAGERVIKVILSDGKEYIAQVVGKDEHSDIALVKINSPEKLPVVTFADSDKVEVADDVLAIGNALGFGMTVTSGIISYKSRSLSPHMPKGSEGSSVLYLQTDAAVNYGNSGGPLFSYDGKVVGMVTVFVGDGGCSTGINFAIPSNTVKKTIEQLRKFGQIYRSWLGIWVELLDHDTGVALGIDAAAKSHKLEKACGCAVKFVAKGSPASIAHIQVGDIILAINNETITEQTNVEYIMSNLPIGGVIPIVIMQQDKVRTINVVVGSKESDDSREIAYSKIPALGVGVSDITAELRTNFNIPQDMHGILVAHLDGDLPLSVGDVILKIGQKEVLSVEAFKAALDEQSQTKVALFVYCPHESTSGKTKGEYRYVSIPFMKNLSTVLNKIPRTSQSKNSISLKKPVTGQQVEGVKRSIIGKIVDLLHI